eukprot:CAMPEP_0194532480 /NCGR_PEP_ID=MMETSP0253-20130528/70051_1 /TAXON_ID=2966 /ORGANISM="Noctiluca scintillans" /LENGTH=816 /DNA_ID=CAMNT_0039377931 /DNA_START=159 /DNA_END=2605 /DNA_ORIENTATION=-
MAFASAPLGLPSEGHMDTAVAGVVESSAPSGQGKATFAGMVSDTADIEMEDVEAAELADGACLQEMLCALSGFGEDEEPLVPVQGFEGWDAEIDTCSTLGREVERCVDDLLEKCAARQDDVETCEVEMPAAGASQDFTCAEPPATTEKRMMLQRLVSQVMQTVDAKTGIRGTDLMKRMRDLHPGLHDDMNRCSHKRLRGLLEAMPTVARLRIENHKMIVHPVRVDAEVVSEASSDMGVVRSVVAGDQRPTQNVEPLRRRQFWSEKCRGRPKKAFREAWRGSVNNGLGRGRGPHGLVHSDHPVRADLWQLQETRHRLYTEFLLLAAQGLRCAMCQMPISPTMCGTLSLRKCDHRVHAVCLTKAGRGPDGHPVCYACQLAEMHGEGRNLKHRAPKGKGKTLGLGDEWVPHIPASPSPRRGLDRALCSPPSQIPGSPLSESSASGTSRRRRPEHDVDITDGGSCRKRGTSRWCEDCQRHLGWVQMPQAGSTQRCADCERRVAVSVFTPDAPPQEPSDSDVAVPQVEGSVNRTDEDRGARASAVDTAHDLEVDVWGFRVAMDRFSESTCPEDQAAVLSALLRSHPTMSLLRDVPWAKALEPIAEEREPASLESFVAKLAQELRTSWTELCIDSDCYGEGSQFSPTEGLSNMEVDFTGQESETHAQGEPDECSEESLVITEEVPQPISPKAPESPKLTSVQSQKDGEIAAPVGLHRPDVPNALPATNGVPGGTEPDLSKPPVSPGQQLGGAETGRPEGAGEQPETMSKRNLLGLLERARKRARRFAVDDDETPSGSASRQRSVPPTSTSGVVGVASMDGGT